MPYLDLTAARTRLAAAELDALLILSPRHFYYATGHNSWFMNLYGEAGYGAALIPADEGMMPAGLVSDVEAPALAESAPELEAHGYPVWIAYGDVPPVAAEDVFAPLAAYSADQPRQRDGQIDPKRVVLQIVDLIKSRHLARGRIGIEISFVSRPVMTWLRSLLPDVTWRDATRLLEELRAVKSPREADLLRRGTQLAESAIESVTAALRSGMTAGEIAHRYRLAVFEHAAGRGDVLSARVTLRVGPHVLSPVSSGSYALQAGDLVFLDCGVEVSGYWADMGRCVVFGRATAAQRAAQKQIYAALRAGFDAATALMQVGTPLADVFRAGLDAVHAAGMTSYVRGNLGHGIGLARAPELPIVSAEETLALARGHVVSVEFPYYVHGIGAFQIEDTFYMGPNGTEVFNRLSRDLVEI
ncbi:MAG: M24 family metallopeptidase [Caldilineaceae bacterium]|nr:M24 family metallopeptidase [Caldilineaceae bacterium]